MCMHAHDRLCRCQERNRAASVAPVPFAAGKAACSFLVALSKLPFCLNQECDS